MRRHKHLRERPAGVPGGLIRCDAGALYWLRIPAMTEGTAMRARSLVPVLIAALCWSVSPTVLSLQEQAAKPAPAPDENLTDEQKLAESQVALFFDHARTALAANDYASAATAYDDALRVLEAAYGADNERVTEALRGIVNTRISWDNYAAQYGFGMKAGLAIAVKAQERIVEIYNGNENVDPYERVAALVDLGDCYLYTNDPRAIDTYRQAWQLKAKVASTEAADELFKAVGLVRLVLPENPAKHKDWLVTVTYDVARDGSVVVSNVAGNAPDEIISDMRSNYAHARFRPRFVGGEPIDTHGITYTHKYAGSAGKQRLGA
jgi:tetratricopeptide (TPR) repeat protein